MPFGQRDTAGSGILDLRQGGIFQILVGRRRSAPRPAGDGALESRPPATNARQGPRVASLRTSRVIGTANLPTAALRPGERTYTPPCGPFQSDMSAPRAARRRR